MSDFLDPYNFPQNQEIDLALNQTGFRLNLGVLKDHWRVSASNSVVGQVAIAATGPHGPFFLSVARHDIVAHLDPSTTPAAPGHSWATVCPDTTALIASLTRVYQLSLSLPDAPLQRFRKAIEAAKLGSGTEREALTRQRIGQDIFRASLDDYWGSRCPLTGISDRALLRASHARPWAECADDNQRLDVFNGLLLAAHWDAAFDSGLVSFNPQGRVMVHDSLGAQAREALRVNEAPPLTLQPEHQPYLTWHRANRFSALAPQY